MATFITTAVRTSNPTVRRMLMKLQCGYHFTDTLALKQTFRISLTLNESLWGIRVIICKLKMLGESMEDVWELNKMEGMQFSSATH
jgi:hypothetical protein